MLSHCLKCKKKTESKNTKVLKTKNGKVMLISNYKLCNSKNLKLIKEQETRGLLRILEAKTPLSKISLVYPLLF